MSHATEIESLLNRAALRPPSVRLKQQVLEAARQVRPLGVESAGFVDLLRYGGLIAACLTMVLLAHWMCEGQIAHWTRPLGSKPSREVDPSMLEGFGEAPYLIRNTRISQVSASPARSGAGDYLNHLHQLLEESTHQPMEGQPGDPPKSQSRNYLFESPLLT
jgi:hypothetical protein